MASAIDATKPADGVLASKLDLRTNLGAAKTEIEALQAEVVALLTALGLSSGATAFPAIAGDNLPGSSASFQVIMQALDAAITAAAGSGGGASSLAGITDILSPSSAIRLAFQEPIGGVNLDSNFTFNEASHAGRLLTLNTTNNSVAMTLPDPATLTRGDGYLCSVILQSGSNFGSITAPTDTLRFQNSRFGITVTQTTVFVGESRQSGLRSFMEIWLDGPVYSLRGFGRTVEAADIRFGAPQTLPGSVLVDASLAAAAFPASLDLGGSKQVGGARGVLRNVAGNTTLAQTDAGKIVVHTGAGAATWSVPDLADGTTIDVDNQGGAVTFSLTGSNPNDGGLTLAAGAAGVVRFANGRTRFIGTT